MTSPAFERTGFSVGSYSMSARVIPWRTAPACPESPPPNTVTHLNTTGTAAQGEMKMFTVDVIAGRKIVVRTTSTVDVDL